MSFELWAKVLVRGLKTSGPDADTTHVKTCYDC